MPIHAVFIVIGLSMINSKKERHLFSISRYFLKLNNLPFIFITDRESFLIPISCSCFFRKLATSFLSSSIGEFFVCLTESHKKLSS